MEKKVWKPRTCKNIS